MIRRLILTTCAPVALAFFPAPVLAQDEAATHSSTQDEEVFDDMVNAMGELFATEPLTAEQEARLPLAQTIVGKIMPDGAMAEMMDRTLGGTLGPIMAVAADAAPTNKLARMLGVPASQLEIEDTDAAALLSTLDPDWKERQQREAAVMPQIMAEMASTMEPAMRKAMSELYAINFSDSELAEIDGFFSTPTGATFARKSFTMASDPRLVAASIESLPQIMGSFSQLETLMAEATADLGTPRSFADLNKDEKAYLLETTGLSEDDLLAAQGSVETEWDFEEDADETVTE